MGAGTFSLFAGLDHSCGDSWSASLRSFWLKASVQPHFGFYNPGLSSYDPIFGLQDWNKVLQRFVQTSPKLQARSSLRPVSKPHAVLPPTPTPLTGVWLLPHSSMHGGHDWSRQRWCCSVQPQTEPPHLLEVGGFFIPSPWKPKNRNTVYLQLHCMFPLLPKIIDGTPSFYWCSKDVIDPVALYGCLCFQKIAFHVSVEGKGLIHIPELLQTSLVIARVCAQSLQSDWVSVSDSLWPYGLWPPRLLCPWGFSRQEYWSGLPCPPPGDLPDPGIEPTSPALQVDSLQLSHQESLSLVIWKMQIKTMDSHLTLTRMAII